MALTKSQIDRAGRIIRTWMQGSNAALMGQQETRALEVLNEFRASHSRPLIKATNGLRSMVRSEGCLVEVSQRLKRMVTIIDKLQRHPTMALSTMQDIGGCRAILESVEEIRRVQRRVVHRRPPIRVDDYITRPPSTGYRAVHLVVRYDDRNIEIQLRTHLMHEWAVAVERLGGRSDIDLKSGEGPLEVLDWLAAVADALAIEDEGRMVDSALVADIDQLRKAAEPYLIRGSRR